MSEKLESGFNLVALLDGTTINGMLRVEGTPLVQRYNKGTNQFIPDFETKPEENRPTVVLILRDGTTGDILTAKSSSIEWKYNSVPLTFDSSGLSTNEGDMKGMFKKITSYPFSFNGLTYNLPALRFMKNLVPISNYDNDRVSVSGTVTYADRDIPFQEFSKEVIIQEMTGNAYDVVITDDKGGALTKENETMTAKATLYKNGIEVTDTRGYNFQWYQLTDDIIDFWTGQTTTITNSDINNVLILRCEVYQGLDLVASGVAQFTDFSDPYYVDFKIEGITGNGIRKNQTATITPIARKRSNGEANPSIKSWKFNIMDNAGKPFAVAGKGSSFTAESVQITYTEVSNAGGGISGSVSTTF